MKPELYILKMSNGQFYIGSTPDLSRRFFEHCEGKVVSTKGKLPVEIVFHREFKTLRDARQAEYKLKSFKNKSIIERIVKDQLILFLGS